MELDIVRKSCVCVRVSVRAVFICMHAHTHTRNTQINCYIAYFEQKLKCPPNECAALCVCVREKLKTKTKLVHGMVNIIQYISYSNSETCTEHTDSKLSVHTNTHTPFTYSHICLLPHTRSCISVEALVEHAPSYLFNQHV